VASKPVVTQRLYESDFALWLQEQALALKERRAGALDWDNLAEEIEGLVRSDRRALRSFLRNALLHMLELAYWQTAREHNQRQWRDHLMNARDGMTGIIEDSPSLEHYLGKSSMTVISTPAAGLKSALGGSSRTNVSGRWRRYGTTPFYPGPATVPRKTRQR
jgi:hypothetical protein